MWQCCWVGMGSPYFFWRLQHLYNQISEQKGEFGSVISAMRVHKPKSTTTCLPREIHFSSQRLLASRATFEVSNHGCDRACNEWHKLVRRDKGQSNTLPAQHSSSECGHQEARAKTTNQVMHLPSLFPSPRYQWKGNWAQGPEGSCKQILLTHFQPHSGVHQHRRRRGISLCNISDGSGSWQEGARLGDC